MSRPVVAAFDFDGTLSEGVSGLRFFRQILGDAGYRWFWVRRFPSLLSYGLRWRHEAALERINRHVFAGRVAADVAREGERYRRDTLPKFLVPATLERLHEHRQRGHRCVIVSRGYDLYLRPWAESLGIRDVIATRLTVGADGRLTGAMPEPSCDGPQKPGRLLAMLGPRDAYELHAYGDGPGDHGLLALADHPWLRTPAGLVAWRPEMTAR